MAIDPRWLLPVLDVLSGRVVRGVGGERQNYRPIRSLWTESCVPLDVASALRSRFGVAEFYLADLDAILGDVPALNMIERLQKDGFHLWVDAGLNRADRAIALERAGVRSIVAGLETLESVDALQEIVAAVGGEEVVFSLDLKNGVPLARPGGWSTVEPLALAEEAISRGVQRIIVLDLANVGVGAGVGTLGLCRSLRERHPRLQIIAGGGVRHPNDVLGLLDVGVDRVLVASALHDGRLDPESVAASF